MHQQPHSFLDVKVLKINKYLYFNQTKKSKGINSMLNGGILSSLGLNKGHEEYTILSAVNINNCNDSETNKIK